MLVCRGEVREFGLTGLTRNQVSLTAPGVRIPPSPPPSLRVQSFWLTAHPWLWPLPLPKRWLVCALHTQFAASFTLPP